MRGPENRTFTVCTVGVRALPEQPRRYAGVPSAAVSRSRGEARPDYSPPASRSP